MLYSFSFTRFLSHRVFPSKVLTRHILKGWSSRGSVVNKMTIMGLGQAHVSCFPCIGSSPINKGGCLMQPRPDSHFCLVLFSCLFSCSSLLFSFFITFLTVLTYFIISFLFQFNNLESSQNVRIPSSSS